MTRRTDVIRDYNTARAFKTKSLQNSQASLKTLGAHQFGGINPTVKGMKFDNIISISNEIVEKYDDFTIKFNTPGVYKIDYRATVFISENNNVGDLHIRPSVSGNLTDGQFLNYEDFGIITTRKRVQISSDINKVSGHAVDSICDSCIVIYDGNGDIYFKLLAWGPDGTDSYIEAGATLIFTLSS